MKNGRYYLTRASVYFSLSLMLTILFISASTFSISLNQLLLSLLIIGSKWIIQASGAILFLHKRTNAFLHGLGRTCLLGSLLLAPYIFLSLLDISDSEAFFFGSLVIAIVVTVMQYYAEVTRLGLSPGWWYFWLICLAITVFLQMSIVFRLF
ncbi:MAG: hypothetical protein FJX92_07640 [Bacteroidetes bacterium]|nr:hypothetical protein [Bacteroidota bacterium]